MSLKKTLSKSLPIPMQDRLIVTKKKPESVSAGGLIIPEMALEKESQGIVVAVGPTVGKKDLSSVIPKVGDKIFYGEYAGIPLPYEGEEYLIIKENDVLCILP